MKGEKFENLPKMKLGGLFLDASYHASPVCHYQASFSVGSLVK